MCLKPDLRVSSTKWLFQHLDLFSVSLALGLCGVECRISFWCYSESLCLCVAPCVSVVSGLECLLKHHLSLLLLSPSCEERLHGSVKCFHPGAVYLQACSRTLLSHSSRALGAFEEREALRSMWESADMQKHTCLSVARLTPAHSPWWLTVFATHFLYHFYEILQFFLLCSNEIKWRTRLRLFDQKYCKNGNIVKKNVHLRKS